MDRLNEVCTWDGETDPETLSNPWDDCKLYNDEDDEDELCDYCGELDAGCDGCCDEDVDDDGYDDDDYDSYPSTNSYW